jgi:peptidylprolyl isomerase
MAQAKDGDTVKVHYTGKLDDGTVFDSSEGREPIEFTIGDGRVIPGFEAAVKGSSPGDRRSTTIPSHEAYGPHRQEMVVIVDRVNLPPELEPTRLPMTTSLWMPIIRSRERT